MYWFGGLLAIVGVGVVFLSAFQLNWSDDADDFRLHTTKPWERAAIERRRNLHAIGVFVGLGLMALAFVLVLASRVFAQEAITTSAYTTGHPGKIRPSWD